MMETEEVLPSRVARRERTSRPFYKKPAFLYAVNGVAIVALVSACVSMHNTISRLEAQASSKSAAMPHM
jgi:hypothetical protein